MVAARSRFLGAGHYEAITTALVAAMVAGADRHAASCPRPAGSPDVIIDVGSGPAHYLAHALDALPTRHGLALDLSPAAIRHAARAHPRAAAVVADAWRTWPLGDHVACTALDIFAPRHGPELARVLCRTGELVVVTPTPHHLAELREPLGLLKVDPHKAQRLATTLEASVRILDRQVCATEMVLTHANVRDLIGMGPNAHHRTPQELAALVAALPEPIAVTASVAVYRFTTIEPA